MNEADAPITVLFTDIEASTSMQSAKGDAAAREVVAACEALAREEISRFGGRVIKSLGDGLMVAFNSPRRAVGCAIAINQSVIEHSQRNPRMAARLRAGLHTGEVLDVDGDLHGATVSAAARICALAEGGQVLASEVVRQLCGTVAGASFLDHGRHVLKGFPERWSIFQVARTDSSSVAHGGTPFVGRSEYRTEFRRLLDRTAGGKGTLVMVGGEPGIGKTRLAHEVALEARQRGLAVSTGHCYQREGDRPYMPWVEMMEAMANAMPAEELRVVLGEHAAALAQMAPELRRVLPDLPHLVEIPADQQRWYLFKGVREFLAGTARERPQVLVVEDLHWADDSTLLLLEDLVEHVEGMAVLIIGTYRDTAADSSQRLSDTLARLVRHRAADLMSLRGLSASEVEEMLRVLGGDVPPPEVTAAIHGVSEGIAFFVEELFRHLAESGRLLDTQGRFRRDLRIDELEVPAHALLIIDRRLDRLSRPTRQMLGVAAVLGRNFAYRTLEAIAESGEDELLDAVEEAERAQIIVADGSAHSIGYRFSHELVRYTLMTQLSGPRRERYHRKVAATLERIHADELEFHAAEIARHLVQSGPDADPVRTAHYLSVAGDRAQAAAAHEEALHLYEEALAITPADSKHAKADLLLRIGTTSRSLRRWDDSIAAWERALDLLEELGDVQAVAQLCFEFSRQLAWSYRFKEMADVSMRGLAVLDDHTRPERARLLAVSALALGLGGRPDSAVQHLDEALQLAEQRGDDADLGEVLSMKQIHHYFFMQLNEAAEAGARAIPKLRASESLWTLTDTLAFQDVAFTFGGRFAEAAVVRAELNPLVERMGHWGAAAVARRNEFAESVAVSADLGVLQSLARHQLSATSDIGNPGWLGTAMTFQGIVAFWRGKWPQAIEHLEEGVRLAMPFWSSPQQGFLLMVRAFCGERDAVYSALDQLEPGFPQRGRPNLLGAWNLAILAGESIGLVGGEDRATKLYPLILEALATGTVMRQLDGRLVLTSAALAAAAGGLGDAAEEHFEASLEQAERLPHLLERPYVRHFYGRFLLSRGDAAGVERAALLLDEAVTGYHTIGMFRHEALARELLDGARSTPRARPGR